MEAVGNPVFPRVIKRNAACGRRNYAAGRVHDVHRGKHAGEVTGRHRAEHRRAEQDRLGFLGQHKPAAGDVGMLAEKDRILGPAAAREHRVDPVAATIHRRDDVAGAVGDGLDRGEVLPREVVGAGRKGQARDGAAEGRIGPGRTVAVEIRLDVQITRKLGGVGDTGRGAKASSRALSAS